MIQRFLLIALTAVTISAQLPLHAATEDRKKKIHHHMTEQSRLARWWGTTKRKAQAVFTKRNIAVMTALALGLCSIKLAHLINSPRKPLRLPPPPVPAPFMGKCNICFEDEQLIAVTAYCGHAYCNECLMGQIDTALKAGTLVALKCPHDGCGREIEQCDILRVFNSRKKGEEHADLTTKQYLATLQDIKQCPGCPNVYSTEATNGFAFCDNCERFFCFRCLHQHTDEEPCARIPQPSNHNEDEEATARITAPCIGCKTKIMRDDGCNHMTCPNTSCRDAISGRRTEFCWVCSRPWAGHDNYWTCQYDQGSPRNHTPRAPYVP